jgi:hypothetical protein
MPEDQIMPQIFQIGDAEQKKYALSPRQDLPEAEKRRITDRARDTFVRVWEKHGWKIRGQIIEDWSGNGCTLIADFEFVGKPAPAG